jgi:hypothetical protein
MSSRRLRLLESLSEIVDALYDLPETHYGSVIDESEDHVQFELGATVLLLAMPALWKDEERLKDLLALMITPPVLLLLGKEEDFFELPDYDSAKMWCLSLPVAEQRLQTNMPELVRLSATDDTTAQDHFWANRLKYELEELMSISRAISSERDQDRLLDLILEKSRYITGADAGSVYVMEETEDPEAPPNLRFKITHNESVQADFTEFTIPVSDKSIVGNAVLRKESINIPDLYRLQPDNPWGVTHDRTWDEKMGYESHSMLTVPMINQQDYVIGVIQLINKKRKPKARLKSAQGRTRCCTRRCKTSSTALSRRRCAPSSPGTPPPPATPSGWRISRWASPR